MKWQQTSYVVGTRTMLAIGGREMDAGNVSLRWHGKGNPGAKPKAEVVADIVAAIRERQGH